MARRVAGWKLSGNVKKLIRLWMTVLWQWKNSLIRFLDFEVGDGAVVFKIAREEGEFLEDGRGGDKGVGNFDAGVPAIFAVNFEGFFGEFFSCFDWLKMFEEGADFLGLGFFVATCEQFELRNESDVALRFFELFD